MCGIAGIISLKDIDIASAIQLMNDTLMHRGPDGEGFYIYDSTNEHKAYGSSTNEQIKQSAYAYSPTLAIQEVSQSKGLALAHRRLAIIDLEATGHQPQCSENNRVWITFNGEIYNYIELKHELENLGHVFIGNSDTEVIIKSYLEWGRACVDKFNGMWAFALFDKTKNELWLSRDRFGVKPLYYYKTNNFFAFASEQKALLALRKLGLLETNVNQEAVFDYFIHSQIEYETEGMLKNIYELMPSNHFLININTLETKLERYYTLSVNQQYEKFNAHTSNEYAKKLESIFLNSIQLRLRSDVPVGACLSGGIDSSAIVSAMRFIKPDDTFHTFNTSFKSTAFDESNFAKLVSDKNKTVFHSLSPDSAGLLNDLENLVYCQDIPIWSTSTYAQFSLMKLVSENQIKVVLDGQGGDELFGGYPHHITSYTFESLRNNFFQGSQLLADNYNYIGRQLLKSNISNGLPGSLAKGLNKFYREDIAYFNQDFLKKNNARFKNKFNTKTDGLNSQLEQELNNSLLKNYLKCEDRCSMFHSVESRTPFSDDMPLIEFAMQIPSSYKIHDGISKYILRESMKSFLPKEITERKDKMGFSTPNNQWIYEIKNDVKKYFENPALNKYIDTKKLLNNYDTFFDVRNNPETGRIFKFISFAVWLKVFELE